MLKPGLYEKIINNEMAEELETIPDIRKDVSGIDRAEASDILARYIADVVRKGLDNVVDNGGDLAQQVAMVNGIVSMVRKETKEEYFDGMGVEERAEQLRAILREKDPLLVIGKKASDLPRPETSIAQSTLFTGASHEPQMFSELKREILSADRIDMLVSFIKWSGLRLIFDELKDFTQNGGELRIITTSYMGATDVRAIEELQRLPNTKIKVSYNTTITRLHAKAYVFHRETGYTTAYVGSSNLSNAALTSGLEWNTKVTKSDLPGTIDKITATFEYYWNDREFEYYEESQKDRLERALRAEKMIGTSDEKTYFMDIRPYSYQQEILDRLEAERNVRGYTNNLVVAATGTGKTVISAFDYRNFRKKHSGDPCRLLFVAHREEILKQSLDTFRAVLKDANFGEMYVGHYRPQSIDHLFLSIQTFNSQDFASKTAPDFYDYIVVDEFHHAAAQTYEKLLKHYKPKILLGLTATPERMDGKSILTYFNERIAAEIRLPEAIDRKLLCPFQYFGVSDSVDLTSVRWTAGGYNKQDLSDLYTISGLAAKKRAELVIQSVIKYVTDIRDVKGLGFCVSVEHARFMSECFNEHGIHSAALHGKSSDEERETVKERLVKGEIRFIFVVDLYNEGVDIPEVNTILFLRPTESLTVFLQQLGRGLRLSEAKECLTVLDFIGQANKRYNFESKFAAITEPGSASIARQVQTGFVSLPKGCYIHLEKLAAKHILDNIRAICGGSSGLVERIATYAEEHGGSVPLHSFLDYNHLDIRSIYKYGSFSRLCARADVIENFSEEDEMPLTKALAKLCVIDSRRWILFLKTVLSTLEEMDPYSLTEIEKRMMRMFLVTLWGNQANLTDEALWKNYLHRLAENPMMVREMLEMLNERYDRIDFIDEPCDLGFDCPLDVHCTYTRDQILVAMDFLKPSTVREGVKWLPERKLDVFFVTLNKADKDYSPTTMYNDYSISDTLFHWQSQSTTNENSATGQRYIHHRERGSRVLLFVREFKTDRILSGAEAYTFLGTANYVKHEGSRPMNITWHLDSPIPAKFLKKTNKLVVG